MLEFKDMEEWHEIEAMLDDIISRIPEIERDDEFPDEDFEKE